MGYLSASDKGALARAVAPELQDLKRLELSWARKRFAAARPDLADRIDGMAASHLLRALGFAKGHFSGGGAYVRIRPAPASYMGVQLQEPAPAEAGAVPPQSSSPERDPGGPGQPLERATSAAPNRGATEADSTSIGDLKDG